MLLQEHQPRRMCTKTQTAPRPRFRPWRRWQSSGTRTRRWCCRHRRHSSSRRGRRGRKVQPRRPRADDAKREKRAASLRGLEVKRNTQEMGPNLDCVVNTQPNYEQNDFIFHKLLIYR